eukprot:Seg353.7 transcript_id=Seg353.7/GoldUCD/mRNA.D3Y31 product="Zinc metalloproteinase nas-38" protein_id=Seg353.7/GoldUCD/D3Y31
MLAVQCFLAILISYQVSGHAVNNDPLAAWRFKRATEAPEASQICGLSKEREEELTKEGAVKRVRAEENVGPYQGDINMTEEQQKLLEKSKKEKKGRRHRITTREVVDIIYGNRWPIAEPIPYEIDAASLSSSTIQVIKDAIEHIKKYTCVRFTERKPTKEFKSYIRFNKGDGGCKTNALGRLANEENRIDIGDGCEILGVVVHEIMHALGFLHEQNRSDRDNYVNIQWQNMIKDPKINVQRIFETERQIHGDDYYGENYGLPYDFNSVMHYHPFAWSKDGKSPTFLLNPKYKESNIKNKVVVGQRNGLSDLDRKKINAMFMCEKLAARTESCAVSKN